MSGCRMLTTSQGGVFLTDVQGYHYYRKKDTSAHVLYVCKEYKKVKSNCTCVVKHMKESNTYGTSGNHNHNSILGKTNYVFKEVLNNVDSSLATRKILANITEQVLNTDGASMGCLPKKESLMRNIRRHKQKQERHPSIPK